MTRFSKCFQLTDGNSFNNCTNSNLTSQTFDQQIQILQHTISNSKLKYEDFWYYGYQLERGMLISCAFNGEICYPRDFITYYDQQYGNCFTFNAKPTTSYYQPYLDNKTDYTLRYTSKPGAEQGLQLEILTSS